MQVKCEPIKYNIKNFFFLLTFCLMKLLLNLISWDFFGKSKNVEIVEIVFNF